MTADEDRLKRETADLRNIQKFISKYIEALCETSGRMISGESREHLGKEVAQKIMALVDGYPRKLDGVADDMEFFMAALERLHHGLLLIGLSEVVRDRKKDSIEKSLNEMLGFRN